MSACRRWGLPALLLLAPLAGCGGRGGDAGAQAQAKAQAAPRIVKVTVAPARTEPVERTVQVVGTLRGWEQVTVGAKRGGRVARVLVDMGDHVAPGDPLVELETVDADLAVEQAGKQLQAELAKLGLTEMPGSGFDVSEIPSVVQARVAAERARQDLARARELLRRGAGTPQDVQNFENDVRSTEAAQETATLSARSILASAQATQVALRVAEQARKEMTVRAPSPSEIPDGHDGPLTYAVTRRDVSEGQILKDGEAVFELVIEDPLRLWANVPERFAPDVAVEQDVRMTVAARPGQDFRGKLTRLNPAVDPVSRTFQVEATFRNERGLLRPGGFAEAAIIVRHADDAIVVPTESIVRFVGVTKVFVVEGGARKVARAVEVATGVEGRGWVEVQGPLPAGSLVVTTGQAQLADGTAVAIRATEPQDPTPAPGPGLAPTARAGATPEMD